MDYGYLEPGGTGARYIHEQGAAASLWSVAHGLGFYPSVSVVDSAGTLVEPDIQYVDVNNVQITNASPFSGRVFLS